MSPLSHRLAVVWAASVLVLAACGGDDDAHPSGAADAPAVIECLSGPALSKIVGVDMGEAEVDDSSPSEKICDHTALAGNESVLTEEFLPADDMEGYFAAFMAEEGDGVETVSGLGGKAAWDPVLHSMIVIHGRVGAEVTMSFFDPPEHDDRALAGKIAEALLAA
jgi:hypothetical protein